MGRSNRARKVAEEDTKPPVALVEVGNNNDQAEAIRGKKEMKTQEIEQAFAAVRERAQGKEAELARMQAELMDLLEKIPDKEGRDFNERLQNFAFKFRDVKKELQALGAEDGLELSPSSAFEPVNLREAANADEPPPVPEMIGEKMSDLSKVNNFKDSSGAILNGVINEKVKGKPVFRGSIKLANGDHYIGYALPDADGSYKFHGEGSLEKYGGKMELVGFFQNGKLKDGHLVEKLADGRVQIQFVKDNKVKAIEVGSFNENDELEGVGERIENNHNTKAQGNFVAGELQDGYVIDLTTNKPLGKWKDGKQVEMGENLPISRIGELAVFTDKEKADSARQKLDREIGSVVDKINELTENGAIDVVHLEDARGQELIKGKLVNIQGDIYFTGKMRTKDSVGREGEFEGIAQLDKSTGVFELEKGVQTLFNSGINSGPTVATIENGVMTEKSIELYGRIKDAKGTSLTNGKKVEGRDKVYYEGEFLLKNGTTFSGKAEFKGGEFKFIREEEANGEKGMVGKVIDKFKNLFAFKRKEEKPAASTEEPDQENKAEPETKEPGSKEETKEEGRFGRMGGAVFAKTVGNDSARKAADILGQVGYRGGAALFGVKIATDALLLGVAKGLEKAGQTSVSKAVGEYSDQYKYLRGSAQIKEIKAGFENFIATIGVKEKSTDADNQETEVEAEKKEFLGANLVNEKYDALKAKIEAADQLDPEAKGKLLAKLEKVKQNFDAENKKLEAEEEAELAKATEAYLVKKVSGMQITRDAMNAAFTVAGLQYIRAGFMGISKVKERMDKNNIFNLQAELEGKKEIGMIKDFGIALLETASGLTGGCFGLQKKDLKTGKELTGRDRFANMVKEFGTAFVAVGVGRLALEDTTHMLAVVNKFFDNISHLKGGEFAHNWMVNAEKQMHFIAHPIDSVKESWDKVTAGKAHAPASGKAPILPKGAEIKSTPASSPVEHKTALARSETAAAAAVAGSGETAVAGASVESSGSASASAEILGAKDLTKVHDFGSWRRQVMESMGYNFKGGKIEHALLFHKGAQIQLVAADGKVVDTYTFKQGGSTWAAMDKFHRDHAELFKGKDSVPGIRIIDTGDAKHATVKVLDHYRVESHQGGQANFKEGGAVGKATLDKVISGEKLSKVGLHDQKISIGPNLQDRIPSGWALSGEEGPKGAITVNGLEDAQGSAEKFLIHATGTNHEKDTRWVDVRSGKIFTLDGDHVGNLNSEKIVSAASAAEGGRVAWSSGGNVSEKVQKELAVHIVHQPAEKEVTTQSVAKTERSQHGGGGAPKERVARAEASTQEATQEPTARTRVEAKPVVNPVDTQPQASTPAEVKDKIAADAPVEAESPKVIASLEASREAIAGMDSLDEIEKTRLTNISHLLEWQKDLYGQNGVGVRKAMEEDGILEGLEKSQANLLIEELSNSQSGARQQFMKDIASGMSYEKIFEHLRERMPGFKSSLTNESDNLFGEVRGAIFGDSDISKQGPDFKAAFKEAELNRLRLMFADKLGQGRFASK